MRVKHLLILLSCAFIAGLALSIYLAPSATPIDENQARICRAVVPAVAGDNVAITVTRVTRGALPISVRVDYRSQAPGGPSRSRHVTCAFAEEGLGARRAELTTVSTERGRMSDASLFFLKRYWLEQPESAAEAPSGPQAAPLLGKVTPAVGYTIQQAVAGLPLICVTGLLATAYALVYGLVGRIVLAFGEFAALGAAGVTLGVALAHSFGVTATPMLLAIGALFAAWITAMSGAVAARLVFAPIVRQTGQHALIATVGLAIAISEGIRLTQGHNARWLAPVWNEPLLLAEAPGFAVITTPITLAVAVAAVAAAVALIVAMRRSRYGLAWRACADDPLAAGLCGVDMQRTTLIACALACGVAGLSGFLLTLHIGGMGFAGGAVFGLKALVGAIVGGVGSTGGALVGGLAVGMLETLWSATMPIEWRDVAVFALLSVVLILRPGGLFGDGQPLDRPKR